jgi:hypothetical protein
LPALETNKTDSNFNSCILSFAHPYLFHSHLSQLENKHKFN